MTGQTSHALESARIAAHLRGARVLREASRLVARVREGAEHTGALLMLAEAVDDLDAALERVTEVERRTFGLGGPEVPA